MANELTLRLDSPIEELIPKLISFNNAELLEAVEERLKAYVGITYDESQVSAAKADRAQLNAFCKALNDERIRIGKIYSSPYDKFKTQVEEVVQKVKTAVDKIDTQVKAFELKKQTEKQTEIIEYYKSVIGQYSGLIPYERVHQTKWLNVGTSIKSIKADIDAIIENAKNALIAISALSSDDEDALKAYYFRTLDLSAALMENERLKAEKRRIAELEAKQSEVESQSAVTQSAESVQVVEEIEKPKTQTIRFQVEGTIEQLKALKNFLQENNIKYSAT